MENPENCNLSFRGNHCRPDYGLQQRVFTNKINRGNNLKKEYRNGSCNRAPVSGSYISPTSYHQGLPPNPQGCLRGQPSCEPRLQPTLHRVTSSICSSLNGNKVSITSFCITCIINLSSFTKARRPSHPSHKVSLSHKNRLKGNE